MLLSKTKKVIYCILCSNSPLCCFIILMFVGNLKFNYCNEVIIERGRVVLILNEAPTGDLVQVCCLFCFTKVAPTQCLALFIFKICHKQTASRSYPPWRPNTLVLDLHARQLLLAVCLWPILKMHKARH